MQQKKNDPNEGLRRLNEAIASGNAGNFYIFHGDERYLLDRSLAALRKQICPGGLDSFNYKRYEGKTVQISELRDAIDTLPLFAERTLIEIHDFDIFKDEQKQKLNELFSDLPEYVCLVFIYDVVPYKPDGRVKIDAQILKNAQVVEFALQEQAKLIKWISTHFETSGKRISASDSAYLALITGGYMSGLHTEINKITAYARSETITRPDIDAVVTPVTEAVVYKLTDALAAHDNIKSMQILDDLLSMQEAPHKLIFSISLKMRQLLAARICIDASAGRAELMEMCGIKYDFQAKSLMETARRMTLAECRDAVLNCSETALDLNSSPEAETRLIELVLKLALGRTEGSAFNGEYS